MEPQDYDILLPYFKMRYSHTCENILVSNFMWKDYYHTHYIRDDHGLIWLMEVDGQPVTMVPVCAKQDLKHYFDVAEAYFNEVLHSKLTVCLADKEAVELLDLDHEKYDILAVRDYYDYVYDAEKLRTFSGKAYHKKKNPMRADMNTEVFPADAIMMKLWLFSGNGKPREILRILSIAMNMN